jgi:hypothetical protein
MQLIIPGNIKEGFPVLSTNRFNVAPVLVDLDLDGDLEIIIGNDSGLLQVLDHNGQEIISYDVGDDIRGGISVADLDNNGSKEILFSGYDDFLHAWNPLDNIEIDGWPIDLMSNSVSEPVTADLDNDGDLEVIAANKSGMLFVFHHDGSSFNGFPTSLNRYIESSPVVGDIDEDGDFEIVIGSSEGLHVFDIKTQRGDIISWKMHRGNTDRSGSLGFTLVNINNEAEVMPSKFSVSKNYPNPFNPSTSIDITIPEKRSLTVKVFDLNGKVLNTLINRELYPGHYSVDWNGKNYLGQSLATGLYIIRVRSGSHFSSQKVLLLK